MFLIITDVYAKCEDQFRRPLWDNLLHYSETILPCFVIGDYNFIPSTHEKFCGRDYYMNKSFKFISDIEACIFVDIGYNGQPYTLCNQRGEGARILKRLNWDFVNDKWLEKMLLTNITHLPSVGLDYFL